MRVPLIAEPTVETPLLDRLVSRRTFLRHTAVAAGGLAGLSLLEAPFGAAAAAVGPKPIPGGFDKNFKLVPRNPALHVFQPLRGGELSTITDFSGYVAATEIQGKATGSDGSKLSFDADMRFMQGMHIATDGRLRAGTFGFI
jgi:hypothetical protein